MPPPKSSRVSSDSPFHQTITRTRRRRRQFFETICPLAPVACPEVLPRSSLNAMKPFRQSIVLSLLTTALMTSQTPNPPAPPVAPKFDHREIRHGATVVDPYFWLREKTSPK